MKTQALVVAEARAPFRLEDVEVDDNLLENEVLVRMKATGICHTDLSVQRGMGRPGIFPVVLGHEGAGTVAKLGSKVMSLAVGDSVVLSYNSCGTCKHCLRKNTSFCSTWERANFGLGRPDGSHAFSRNGQPVSSHFFGQSSFSRYSVVMERSLIKVPKDAPLHLLGPLGCGIMTGAGAMLNVAKLSKDSSVAIIGTGAVGLAALMAVKLAPVQPEVIICVDVVEERLQMAKKYGATHVINSKDCDDLAKAILTLTSDLGVDSAIETTGRPSILKDLFNATAKKGVVVSIGVHDLSADVSINIFKAVNAGWAYTGCCMGNCYPPDFISRLMNGWESGKFPFDELIKTYDAKDIDLASSDLLSGKTVKAVLLWD